MSEFDITRESPDAGHEAIRLAVVQAIENLDYNTGDVSVLLELIDQLFTFLDESLAQRSALAARLDDLETRIGALEPTPAPE